MASKAVLSREKTEADLVGVLTAWQGKTTGALEEILGPLGGDGAFTSLALFQGLLGGRLQRLRARMVEADVHHRKETLRDRELRTTRDEAARQLAHRLSRLRTILDQACGPGTFQDLWYYEGPMTKDPVVLQRIGRRIVDSLEQEEEALPPSEVPGVDLSPEAWIPYLSDPLHRLAEALHGLSQEVPGTRKAVVDRHEAIRDYDRAYGATARILENLLIYAGRDDLAVHVRPKRRRRRATSAEAPEAPTAQETPEDSAAPRGGTEYEPKADLAAVASLTGPKPVEAAGPLQELQPVVAVAPLPEPLSVPGESTGQQREPGPQPERPRRRRGFLSLLS